MNRKELIRNVKNGEFVNKVDLSGMDLSRADLRGGIFMEVNFKNTNLTRASMRESVFQKCDFSGADMSFVVGQLEKSEGNITTFAKVLARTLKRYIKDGTVVTGKTCPKCDSTELIRAKGCIECSCGWTAGCG